MTNKYTCFDLEIKNKVAYVTMCRPDEYNTMNKAFWSELPHLVEKISDDASARVIVLSSTGKHFCAGMDLANFSLSDNPTEPKSCLLYTSPSPRDSDQSRMPSSA